MPEQTSSVSETRKFLGISDEDAQPAPSTLLQSRYGPVKAPVLRHFVLLNKRILELRTERQVLSPRSNRHETQNHKNPSIPAGSIHLRNAANTQQIHPDPDLHKCRSNVKH